MNAPELDLQTSTPTAGIPLPPSTDPEVPPTSLDGETVGVDASCTCGSPSAFALSPNETVVHRQDGPCFIAVGAST